MLDNLQAKHGITDIIRFEPGNGGLIKAVLTTPNGEGEIYLHGAHVTHYQPRGQEPVLFVSRESRFTEGKAIRGGVPICFPWFGSLEGRDTAPAHGFARTSQWQVKSTESNPDGSASITLELQGGEDRNSFWPHAFRAEFAATFGQSLRMELTVFHVRGEPFLFEEAMHSYFQVKDAREVTVTGLAGTAYLDKTRENREMLQGVAPIRITEETDRVYLETTADCVLNDPKLNRKITVRKTGSASTVLWNPWIAKSKSMADFGDEEWPGMLCIETCNVGRSAVKLSSGESHTMTAEIKSEGNSSS